MTLRGAGDKNFIIKTPFPHYETRSRLQWGAAGTLHRRRHRRDVYRRHRLQHGDPSARGGQEFYRRRKNPCAPYWKHSGKWGSTLPPPSASFTAPPRVTNALLEGAGEPSERHHHRGLPRRSGDGAGASRPQLYSVKEVARPPLAPRRLRHVLRERIGADGSGCGRVDQARPRRRARPGGRGRADGRRRLPFALLPQPGARAAPRRPGSTSGSRALVCTISLGRRARGQGEYERFATTVLNAQRPAFRSLDYLRGSRCRARGRRLSPTRLSIMTSSGGVVSTDEAGRLPINLALSGPAGGVAASVHLAGLAGYPERDHLRHRRHQHRCLPDHERHPVDDQRREDRRIPEQHLSGRDQHDRRRRRLHRLAGPRRRTAVGPRSAGLDRRARPPTAGAAPNRPPPTPIWSSATSIPHERLGGEVRLDVDAARAAVARLAAEFRTSTTERPPGILQIATIKMTSAIKEISVALRA